MRVDMKRQDLKAARLMLGESQATFAKRLGIDQGTLSRWEQLGVPQNGPAEMAVASLMEKLKAQFRKLSSRDG